MLRITLLGSPTILLNDQPIEISRRKALALFFYLVATKRPHSREHLCLLLWFDTDTTRARAELRRMLHALNKTPLADYIEADRQNIRLVNTDTMQVDLWELESMLNAGDWSALMGHMDSWFLPFMQGFAAGDAAQFDDWQMMMSTQIRQRLTPVLEQFATHFHKEEPRKSITLLKRWLTLEPENEGVHRWLMRCYAENDEGSTALEHYRQWKQHLWIEFDMKPEPETIELAEQIRKGEPLNTYVFAGGVLPPLPGMLIGREDVLAALREKLGMGRSSDNAPFIVMQGWPGIGKTTLTASLAHDPAVQRHFKDGILWASLGQSPDSFATLINWGNALGIPRMENAKTVTEASQMLTSALHDSKVIIIVDDVWNAADFLPFKVGGAKAATIVTTRLNQVAGSLITSRRDLFKIPILDRERSLELLHALAPDAVESYPHEVGEMIDELEGLPLALQVVGRLLREEHLLGWGARELLQDLQAGTRLLSENAPLDRQLVDEDAVPLTVMALLELSTNSLDDTIRQRFALLGVFAPKPAVFELEAMEAVWEVNDARPTVRRLVERGLLDIVPGGEFQMHALLVQHARQMFDDQDAL